MASGASSQDTNTPSQPSSTPLAKPRTHPFHPTLSHTLPAQYDELKDRWISIAKLYYEASTAIMATDRAAGANSLRAEIKLLENDIKDYRDVVKGIRVEDLMAVYLVAGRQRWRAEQIAKEDIEDIESSLKEIEEKVREVKADIVHGFEQQ
ncbi:hypothetical protein CC86DRAFT_291478 [Ophiobolus disseminans]|uniref:Uncharacterized protein n=1 Tax=Ophiobolus disseminans TaxID=1469910 RepID=A0A6A7A2D3_9PLEO|nr:hypothetical protein CC86DRAFT_291478 [Ophiobolus disseminans]